MAALSSASFSVMEGKIPGSRVASMVLPVPGGPSKIRLWPPAAAISMARLAWCWPTTSERSSAMMSSVSVVFLFGNSVFKFNSCWSFNLAHTSNKCVQCIISRSLTSAASCAFCCGKISFLFLSRH